MGLHRDPRFFLFFFRAVVSPACLPSAPSVVSSSAFHCPSLFACSFCFFFIFGGGCVWLGYGVYGAGRWSGCVLVPVLVWAWVPWGGCCALGSLCVCRPTGIWRLSVSGVPVRGALAAGGRRQQWCGACVGRRRARVAPGWRGWTHVGVFVARAVWVVGSPLLGAGRLVWVSLVLWCLAWALVRVRLPWVRWGGVPGMCAPKGVVGRVGPLRAMQRAVKMPVMPTGGVL